MIHCPHLTPDNQCEVAAGMAGCKVRTSPAACNACQNETNPRAINVVTIGMALVNKRRRKRDAGELSAMLANYMPDRDELPATLKIADYRPGPGNELKKMLAWFAKPSETCNCPEIIEHGSRRHNHGMVTRRSPAKRHAPWKIHPLQSQNDSSSQRSEVPTF